MSEHCGRVSYLRNKKEATSRLRARDVGAMTTLGILARTDLRKMMVMNLGQWYPMKEMLGISSLTEGAAGAFGE